MNPQSQYTFSFGYQAMDDSIIYFSLNANPHGKHDDIFYQVCLLLIETFDIYYESKWLWLFDTKLTKQILKQRMDDNKSIRAKTINNNYNQVVQSNKQFNVLLNVCDKIAQVPTFPNKECSVYVAFDTRGCLSIN